MQRWFEDTLGAPTHAQRQAWPLIQRGEHTLVAAPTGSGKTLAAFLVALDGLVREGAEHGTLPDETRVLYVSPLKALSHDVEKNLNGPLAGIAEEFRRTGGAPFHIRTWVRTGDTSARSRLEATKRPPHIAVTTPESLYILLTSEGGRRMLSTVRTVIVDEIHALVRDKRGSHLALSIARLEALVRSQNPAARLTRVGLSATQKPIEEIARYLVSGATSEAGAGEPREPACNIVDTGHRRQLDLELEMPESPLEAVMSGEVWEEIYQRLTGLIGQHRTTLVFVNTRRVAERVAKQLSERLGEDRVSAHHGSLSREKRLDAETRLKAGQLSVLVATASLELGIDVGEVDLVCQLGSPRSIATFLQRVGRSGHHLAGIPKGRLFPLSRDDLLDCSALLESVRVGELDRVHIPEAPLDVLAQQIVAASACEELGLDELYALCRSAYPYRELARADFDAVLEMLGEGFATQRGRRGALVHLDAVQRRVKGRRGARLLAITSGGAIPDTFDYEVQLEPEQVRVGTVHEDFAIESMQGDVFQLGNHSYRIRKVEPGILRVEDAKGQPPSLPFWVAEAPGRTTELSQSVSRLRSRMDGWLSQSSEHALQMLREHYQLGERAARELTDYLAASRALLGSLPTRETLVLERFFDETGSMHLVLHSPFGSRVNRAFGLALRKRFCRSFNVELQAAATDDAIVLSLGPMHSFELGDVFHFVKPRTARDVLIQAMLDAPMFGTRFRWNASRALAIPRFRGGKKVPPRFQRMLADDLLACAFPDQVACAENLTGERQIPEHPLVKQTIHDCLHEAMDIEGMQRLVEDIAQGNVVCLARDVSEPSPLAQEVISARPYAFLDDAPLEERRTQAVMQRRFLDPETAQKLGALDADAIARVVAEARVEARDADELHDALLVHCALPASEFPEYRELFQALHEKRRAFAVPHGGRLLWVAAERLRWLAQVSPDAVPDLSDATFGGKVPETREAALRELVRGRLELVGPTTADEMADALGLLVPDVEAALHGLETEGFVLRGRFRPSSEGQLARGQEWCERRLLARIHRATLERLRAEIEPVTPAVFMRFLLGWQHLGKGNEMQGLEGLYAVVDQLSGFELAAVAWERDVLAARVRHYDPGLLDALSFTGRVSWSRVRLTDSGRTPIRTTPIALYPREQMELFRIQEGTGEPALSSEAQRVHEFLRERGASFFNDIARGSGLLKAQVESALAELVACGRVNSDGFAGLRGLFSQSAGSRHPLRRRSQQPLGMEGAGRYGLLALPAQQRDPVELARALLKRWGVVFRRVLDRESVKIAWGELVPVLRRMEARGEVRGGRFVSGFSGEQYALPEAVSALRKQRRDAPQGELISISAADPLNLIGLITPGQRLASQPRNRVLFEDGVPVAALDAGEVKFLRETEPAKQWALESALVARRVRPEVRAYQGNVG
ncbi:MAG: DEAD/DEAH box helicase [Myxococcales bacterium]